MASYGVGAYENWNYDITSNGEKDVIMKMSAFQPTRMLDVGAHIGEYTKTWVKIMPDTEIHAFEITPSTFAILSENIHDHNVRLNPFGLASFDGSIEVNCYPDFRWNSCYQRPESDLSSKAKVIQAKVMKGSSYMKKHNIGSIDFLKMDVEGAEYEILLGFQKRLKDASIKVIQFEYGYPNIVAKKLLYDFYKLLEDCDYMIGKIYPKYVEFREYMPEHEDFRGPNYLAVHKSRPNIVKRMSMRL